jgi:hypothetical protein
VDSRAIERFEGDVRGGMTHHMIMASVGKQPGLLCVHDLLLIFYVVWVPCALDFSVHGVGRGNEMVCTFMFVVCPLAQGPPFLVVASVASALYRVRADWPKLLLYVVLCFVGMILCMLTFFTATSMVFVGRRAWCRCRGEG